MFELCKNSKNGLLFLFNRKCNNPIEVIIMKNLIAGNITRYRKANGLTQEELGNQLGITFQAVSKWETEQAMPDITILPQLARLLSVSIDKLLGYDAPQTYPVDFDVLYRKDEYYGGVIPAPECLKVFSLLPSTSHLKLLEIGCGEGKNAVFFARCGYDVSALDLSDAGIEKTKRLADNAGVHVNVFKADLNDFRLDCKYDIIFARNALHFIKPELRCEIIENYRQHTNIGGLHAFNVFIEKPFTSDDFGFAAYSYLWRSGMLLAYYHDWLIEDFSEYIIEKSPGHQHALNQIYTRKK